MARISVIHHNPKRIDRRFTDIALSVVCHLQATCDWAANIKDDITIHYTGCPDHAYGAYRWNEADKVHDIYIRPRKRHPAGLAYTIAHELRHAWQVEQGLLSTMGGKAWQWYDAQGNAVLCDGGDNDPSENDAEGAASAYCRKAW